MISPLHSLQEAAKAALRLRVLRGYALDRPCDVYELISDSDLDLQFVDVPSLEGMYLHEGNNQRVCVCGRRPAGRQRFTAAHELGHCVLGHGSMIDASGELGKSLPAPPEEQAADVFARYLLMPPRAVYAGFRYRGVDPASPNPLDAYIVSSWLGVGYSALVNHMNMTLKLYDYDTHDALLRTSVKQLKQRAASVPTTSDVWLLDSLWGGCTVHTQLGDVVRGLAQNSNTSGLLVNCGSNTWVCSRVGEGLFAANGGASVRMCVSQRDYIGFYKYRYLSEQ
jgi:Zn-dependent peptidase ImmA (M78 family)